MADQWGPEGVLNLCLALWRRGRDPQALMERSLKEKKKLPEGR